MRRTIFFIVGLLGMEGSFAACKSTKPEKSTSDHITPKLWVDPSGSTGINGLKPGVYWDTTNWPKLVNAMGSPLWESTKTLNSATFSALIAASDLLVKYAISCAVDQGSVTTPSTAVGGYTGSSGTKSLLRFATGWTSAALSTSQQNDLHTCIATRLNPVGAEVNIWLGGSHVTNDGVDHSSEFGVDEAYWATFNVPNRPPAEGPNIDINVWPSPSVKAHCPDDSKGPGFTGAVNTRACGTLTPPTTCKVIPRKDYAKCAPSGSGVDSGWSCPRLDPSTHSCDCKLGGSCPSPNSCVEVIKTKLRCEDWCTFYPGCEVPDGTKDNEPNCVPALEGKKTCDPLP